jgi:hypothetical protein
LLLIGNRCPKEEIDVNKKLHINSRIFDFFILIFTLFASLLYLTGCTLTPKALQLANEKAAPQYEYRNFRRIESAVKQENGDVSLCVALSNADEMVEPKLSIITIPLAIFNGEVNQHERYGFYPGECPIPCYWYPIEKVEKGCDKTTPENLSTASVLPIEKLTIHSQDQFYDLPNFYNGNQKIPAIIFEVSYPSRDISIIYWFVQIDQQQAVPNSISGVYEDTSTKLYYLTVPPAIVGDVIIDVVVVAVTIAGIALGVYLQLL